MPDVKMQVTSGIAQDLPSNVVQPGAGAGGSFLPQASGVTAKPWSTQRDKVYRRRLDVSGRLFSLSHATPDVHSFLMGDQDGVSSAVVINFPHMPQSVDLARKADYQVTSTFFVPDGVHFYKGTAPLEIPLTFSLHAFDDAEYCEHGALTLLVIAGRLHSLTLPISRGGAAGHATTTGPLFTEPSTSNSATEKRSVDSTPTLSSPSNPPLFPVACGLHLIYSGDGRPGISCVGYVKDVNVKLKGPWLRSKVPYVKNLPTSAEYSFTFVHRPGHTNRFNSAEGAGSFDLGVQINAFADDVKNGLYNTVGLLTNQSIAYQGFDQKGSSQATPAVLVTPPPSPLLGPPAPSSSSATPTAPVVQPWWQSIISPF